MPRCKSFGFAPTNSSVQGWNPEAKLRVLRFDLDARATDLTRCHVLVMVLFEFLNPGHIFPFLTTISLVIYLCLSKLTHGQTWKVRSKTLRLNLGAMPQDAEPLAKTAPGRMRHLSFAGTCNHSTLFQIKTRSKIFKSRPAAAVLNFRHTVGLVPTSSRLSFLFHCHPSTKIGLRPCSAMLQILSSVIASIILENASASQRLFHYRSRHSFEIHL